jgi:excisionase family DNA binding protein
MSRVDTLTVSQVAKRLGKNPETVRRWIWSGKLRSTKVGNQHFVAVSDLPDGVSPEERAARDREIAALHELAAIGEQMRKRHPEVDWSIEAILDETRSYLP